MPQEPARVADQSLCRLVYYSRNRIAGSPADIEREIEAILTSSQRNNAACGITGALIFNLGMFAQLLEGPCRDIESTFERIQCDPRHGDVNVLALEAVVTRSFPDWSMAFLGRSQQEQQIFSQIGLTSCFESKRVESERIFALMREMALEDAARSKTG